MELIMTKKNELIQFCEDLYNARKILLGKCKTSLPYATSDKEIIFKVDYRGNPQSKLTYKGNSLAFYSRKEWGSSEDHMGGSNTWEVAFYNNTMSIKKYDYDFDSNSRTESETSMIIQNGKIDKAVRHTSRHVEVREYDYYRENNRNKVKVIRDEKHREENLDLDEEAQIKVLESLVWCIKTLPNSQIQAAMTDAASIELPKVSSPQTLLPEVKATLTSEQTLLNNASDVPAKKSPRAEEGQTYSQNPYQFHNQIDTPTTSPNSSEPATTTDANLVVVERP